MPFRQAPHNMTRIYFFLCFVIIFSGMVSPRLLAYLPSLAGVAMFVYFYMSKRIVLTPPWLAIGVLGGFIVWVLIGSLWSESTADVFSRALTVGLIAGGGLIWIGASAAIPPQTKRSVFICLLVLYMAGCLFLAAEQYFKLPLSRLVLSPDDPALKPSRLNRSMVFLSLLMPVMLFSSRYVSPRDAIVRLWQCTILICLFAALIVCKSQTAQLSALVGVIVYYTAPVGRRALWHVTAVLIVIAGLSLPFVVAGWQERGKDFFSAYDLAMDAGVPHRFEIWHFTAEKVLEKPWFGHGIEAMRHMTSGQWMTYMKADTVLHPHNATLQIWLEFGLAGALGWCALLLYVLHLCRSMGHTQSQRLALAVFLATLCMMHTGFGVWQSWQIGLVVFLVGLAACCRNMSSDRAGP